MMTNLCLCHWLCHSLVDGACRHRDQVPGVITQHDVSCCKMAKSTRPRHGPCITAGPSDHSAGVRSHGAWIAKGSQC